MITPQPIVLEGHGVRLEPMERSHASALAAAANDGELWKLWYVAVAGLAPGKEVAYVDAALDGLRAGHMVPWVVRELSTGAIVGSTRYHDIVCAIDRVEIGFTFYAASWQRTHVNTATKLLLLAHAFDELGCQVVGFRADGLNVRSQQAIEALGAKKDGALRHFQARADGSARDIHLYSILASEWPDVKKHLHARLERNRSLHVRSEKPEVRSN
jgi:RimJ/RimL family protein N-acetyltransferase